MKRHEKEPPEFYAWYNGPSMLDILTRPLTPKEKWKRDSHEIRYFRRYGVEEPSPSVELGIWGGIRFIP